MLAAIVTWSDKVRWDVVSESYGSGVSWLERVDRFWIDGDEYAVRCNGVFTVRDDLVSSMRDYVDLGEWRSRAGPALERMAARPPTDVVERHLRAVKRLDLVAMSADYAIDACLVRGGERFDGLAAIAGYFDTVPARLGDASLEFGTTQTSRAGEVTVPWTIRAGTTTRATGLDTYVVERGRITHQTVALDREDF